MINKAGRNQLTAPKHVVVLAGVYIQLYRLLQVPIFALLKNKYCIAFHTKYKIILNNNYGIINVLNRFFKNKNSLLFFFSSKHNPDSKKKKGILKEWIQISVVFETIT